MTVIDDFAHHSTAVRETLAAARAKYPGCRLVAVFEPRSYTAQVRAFQEQFELALSEANSIVIAGLFHPERYTADSAISPVEMAGNLRRVGREAEFIPSVDEIVSHLAPRLKLNDIVVIMSNGSFGGIHAKLMRALAG